jgi:SNF2 family DNA or RNA helicase
VRELWAHQKQAVSFALQQKNFALFHEMGGGKTGTLINILRHKYAEKGHIRKTIIFSPIITLENWKKEFANFSRIKDTDIIVLRGTGKKKFETFVDAVTDPETMKMSRNRIIILNYECVQNKELFNAIKLWRPEILVCDEAHRVRSPSGKRSKAIVEIADKAEHKYILTGTPILNSTQDVFQQYRILDGGASFGTNFYLFRARYFRDKNAGWQGQAKYFPDWEPRVDLYGELQRKMYFDEQGRVRAHRVLKKDCMDLPPLIKVKIEVELGKEQKKMYEEMKKHFLTYVQDLKEQKQPLAVVANLAVTKALRLQQIASGFVKADDGQEYPITDVPRINALSELLEDVALSGKVIIWACFKQNYKEIAKLCETLELKYVLLTGEQSTAEKELAMKEFRTNDDVKVIIANQAAGGVGVNLVEAPVSIFYSRNFSLENDMQAEARNYRGGSEMHQRVTRYDIIAKDTIDELVTEALSCKQDVSQKILEIK